MFFAVWLVLFCLSVYVALPAVWTLVKDKARRCGKYYAFQAHYKSEVEGGANQERAIVAAMRRLEFDQKKKAPSKTVAKVR